MSSSKLAKIVLSLAAAASFLAPAFAYAAELVMFEREGCVWCQRWDRDIGAIYQKTPEARLLPLRRIDIARQTAGNVALTAPVRYTPTFVIVDNGREVGRITGYINDDAFWGLLGKFAAKLESRHEPNRI